MRLNDIDHTIDWDGSINRDKLSNESLNTDDEMETAYLKWKREQTGDITIQAAYKAGMENR